MKEHPILFSAEMVRAILDGRKTQTRRVIKPQPPRWHWSHDSFDERCINVAMNDDNDGYYVICPHGKPGDRLWVRETWRPCACERCNAQYSHGAKPFHEVEYRADGNDLHGWRPSIFMPRWASRITLEIVNIRVEKVQDISEEDAIAEGIERTGQAVHFAWKDYTGNEQQLSPKMSYQSLWDSINADRGYGWDLNPWVWVIEFKRLYDPMICMDGHDMREGANDGCE